MPEVDVLKACSAPLIGTHDFLSFANRGSAADHPGSRGTVRTVHRLHWSQEPVAMPFPGGRDAYVVHMDVVGNGFFYKMVRTLVGTVLKAARRSDRKPLQTDAMQRSIVEILSARDRRMAGTAMPPEGLTLMSVCMKGDDVPSWMPSHLVPRASELDPDARTSDPATDGAEIRS